MTKITSALVGTLFVFAGLASFAFAVSAYADTQDLRSRGTSGRTVDLTPAPIPTPAPVVTILPPAHNPGGITSQTTGEVDTGGNSGGNVTTGDENVDVHEVNVGPTNPPPPTPPTPPAENPTPTAPTPSCDGRTRTGCTDSTGRTR